MTGTVGLLTLLDPYVPDGFINDHWNVRPLRGPHWHFSAAQLWRTHLLTVLTPVHSVNQMVALLPEQRAWRSFARLSHRERVPDVRMLNEFRARLGVSGLRAINEALTSPLIERAAGWPQAVALRDATDLEAACDGFKKKRPRLTLPAARRWENARSKPARAAGLWVTKSTPCGCGGANTRRRWCCCRW